MSAYSARTTTSQSPRLSSTCSPLPALPTLPLPIKLLTRLSRLESSHLHGLLPHPPHGRQLTPHRALHTPLRSPSPLPPPRGLLPRPPPPSQAHRASGLLSLLLANMSHPSLARPLLGPQRPPRRMTTPPLPLLILLLPLLSSPPPTLVPHPVATLTTVGRHG